jgi:hypothetical protein
VAPAAPGLDAELEEDQRAEDAHRVEQDAAVSHGPVDEQRGRRPGQRGQDHAGEQERREDGQHMVEHRVDYRPRAACTCDQPGGVG